MTKKIIGMTIGGIILLFLVLGIARSRQREEVPSIAKIQAREGIPVLAATVGRHDVRQTRDFYGTLRAGRSVNVSAKLMDRIAEIPVHVGDRVSEGQVLVKFDTTASQASVVQLRLAMESARKDYERLQTLYDKGAVSRQQLDQVKLGYDIARENYLNAHRSVELAAPISATVARVDVNEGDFVNPGDILMELVDTRSLEVEFELSQEDRANLRGGQAVRVRLDGQVVEGRITHVSLSTRPGSRLFNAYATVSGSDHLYPGMLATVQVTLRERKEALAVPREAILDRGKGPFVVVVANGQAHLQPVRIGLQGEQFVEILDGLAGGETVATYGHANVEEGDRIKIVEEGER